MNTRYAVTALLACALATPAQAELKSLAALQREGARITAAVVDLDGNDVIEQLNPQQRLSPASLTKLAITAAALKSWPADKAFQTRIVATSAIVDGKLAGDLNLVGAGDPSLDEQSLWNLAAQLRSVGIGRVGGSLVVTPAPFGVVACETRDRCEALKRSDTAYNAPLASIGVDFGNWCVTMRPGKPGESAALSGCAGLALPIPVEGTIRTAREGARADFRVERFTTAEGDKLRVGGEIATGDAQNVYRAMSDPALGAGLLLREALRAMGIEVTGPVVISTRPVPAESRTLAQVEGLTLREQLGRMLRYSNNYIADVLTLNLAAALTKQPPTQLSTASGVLGDVFVRGPQGGPALFSGSGLTPENQMSANDLVGLLGQQYRDSRRFPAFYGGLVVPRDAPFAFLRQGNAAWLDRVALKTGTMNEPYSVCGIAGYLRKRDGGFMAFAVIVNGGPKLVHVPLYKAMEAARSDIEAVLAQR